MWKSFTGYTNEKLFESDFTLFQQRTWFQSTIGICCVNGSTQKEASFTFLPGILFQFKHVRNIWKVSSLIRRSNVDSPCFFFLLRRWIFYLKLFPPLIRMLACKWNDFKPNWKQDKTKIEYGNILTHRETLRLFDIFCFDKLGTKDNWKWIRNYDYENPKCSKGREEARHTLT